MVLCRTLLCSRITRTQIGSPERYMGDHAFAAEYRYVVRPGGIDCFHDGRFWYVKDDGTETEAEYIPTEQDKINALQKENAQLKAESNDLTLAMAEMIGGKVDVE